MIVNMVRIFFFLCYRYMMDVLLFLKGFLEVLEVVMLFIFKWVNKMFEKFVNKFDFMVRIIGVEYFNESLLFIVFNFFYCLYSGVLIGNFWKFI